MKKVLEIERLHFQRGHSFSLEIPYLGIGAGELVCIVGPNGSGKTTLLENATGILQPQTGRISIIGEPIGPNLFVSKSRLGYIPDDDNWFVAELTASEYISLLENVYRQAGCQTNMRRRAKQIAKDLQFVLFDQPLSTLSHGNKRKVQLMAGMMHQPPCIIVDELRNGLDPLAVIAAERLIQEELARGAAILTASHDLWWAERLAKKIIFLHNGEVARTVEPRVLRQQQVNIEDVFLEVVGVGQR